MSTDTNQPLALPTNEHLRFNTPLLLAVILAAITLSLLQPILIETITKNTIPIKTITTTIITFTTSTGFFLIAHMERTKQYS